MTILVWLILGLVAGWIASLLVSGGNGLIGDIVVGVVGAFVGGWLGSVFLGIGVTGLDFTSIALAVVGAVIVLALFRAVVPGRRRSM